MAARLLHYIMVSYFIRIADLLFILSVCCVKPSPSVARCVHPSQDLKPRMVRCRWTTLANGYSSQNLSLLWQSPRHYFSCHFTSRPGISQLAFLNHFPQPESHGVLKPLNISARKSCTCRAVPKEQ